MQDAVHGQVAEVVGQRLVLCFRLVAANAEGQHQIAEVGSGALRRGEGQDVGRPVPVAEAGVQILNCRVVGQQHDDVARNGPQRRHGRAGHDGFGFRQGRQPVISLDLDLDHAGSSRSGAGRPFAASAS